MSNVDRPDVFVMTRAELTRQPSNVVEDSDPANTSDLTLVLATVNCPVCGKKVDKRGYMRTLDRRFVCGLPCLTVIEEVQA